MVAGVALRRGLMGDCCCVDDDDDDDDDDGD